jgi:endoglucanase
MPRYGFNFLWMFSSRDSGPESVDERALDFLAKHEFDFVRVPCDYRFWTQEFRYFEPNEAVFEVLDSYLEATRDRGLHLSLNLHRAPGYCINRNDLERHNLWLDAEAQDAFVWLWEGFARRYLGVPNDFLSFDLLNEPPDVGHYGMTREIHASVMRRTVAAIRAIDPTREIVIDGLGGGHLAMPELADLGVIHSGRGYQPMPISHWGANWWTGWKEAPAPRWPGQEWDGLTWDADQLWEFYAPWREVAAVGVPVHIGEFGCYNQTPNDVAMAWMQDLLAVFKRAGWGYGLWNFEGDFGIIGHNRSGAKLETIDGYAVDREYFELLKEARV